MPRTLKELQDARTELVGQIRRGADEFNKNDKKFKDGEANKTWDKINADYDQVMREIEELNQAGRVDARLAEIEKHGESLNTGRVGLDDASQGSVGGRRAPGHEGGEALNGEVARELCINAWARAQYGIPLKKRERQACRQLRFNPNAKQLRFPTPTTDELNKLRNAWLDHTEKNRSRRPFEYNAPLTTGVPSSGGTVIPPQTLLTAIEVNLLAFGSVRSLAETIVTSSGEPLAWPTFDDTSNEGRMIPESTSADDNAGTGSAGDGGPNPTFGKTVWGAHKFTSDTLLVPYESLEDSVINLAQLIGDALGMRYSRGTNRKFTTGTGVLEPYGVAAQATLGVTAAGAAAITADEIIDLEHSVDAEFRTGASYMFHDLVLAHLRKLKASGTGEYIWMSGFNTGAPDLINNRPYSVNNHMATLATGNTTVLFGNFMYYKIRRVNGVRVYRLEERYRSKDQDGFVLFGREDGGILNPGTAPIKKLVQA